MVTRQRQVERERNKRRLEVEKEKEGTLTSNMSTTQGAGLGGKMGGEGETRKEKKEVGGGRGELWLLCSLWTLPF